VRVKKAMRKRSIICSIDTLHDTHVYAASLPCPWSILLPC
jgi:hypothetical protein